MSLASLTTSCLSRVHACVHVARVRLEGDDACGYQRGWLSTLHISVLFHLVVFITNNRGPRPGVKGRSAASVIR